MDRLQNLLEASIELHENDMKMFNAVIESEFITSANEQVMTESSFEALCEAEASTRFDAIKEKISQLFDKFIKAVGDFFEDQVSKLWTKFESVINQGTFKALEKHIDASKLDGFEGLDNFAMPTSPNGFVKDVQVMFGKYTKAVSAIWSSSLGKLTSAGTADDAIASFTKRRQELYAEKNTLIDKYLGKAVDKYHPIKDNLTLALTLKNVGSDRSDLFNIKKLVIDSAKEDRDKFKSSKESESRNKNIADNAAKMYSFASQNVHVMMKLTQETINAYFKGANALRKLYMVFGYFCMKNVNEGCYAIAEACDLFEINNFGY